MLRMRLVVLFVSTFWVSRSAPITFIDSTIEFVTAGSSARADNRDMLDEWDDHMHWWLEECDSLQAFTVFAGDETISMFSRPLSIRAPLVCLVGLWQHLLTSSASLSRRRFSLRLHRRSHGNSAGRRLPAHAHQHPWVLPPPPKVARGREDPARQGVGRGEHRGRGMPSIPSRLPRSSHVPT